jgi:hypothetical protein
MLLLDPTKEDSGGGDELEKLERSSNELMRKR